MIDRGTVEHPSDQAHVSNNPSKITDTAKGQEKRVREKIEKRKDEGSPAGVYETWYRHLDFDLNSFWAQGARGRDEVLGMRESQSTRERLNTPPPKNRNRVELHAYPSLDATGRRQPSRLLEVSVNLGGHPTALAKK